MSKKSKFEKWTITANNGLGFFRPRSGERTIKIGCELWESPAYATLSFSARLLLLDWIRHYYELSSWESRDITDIGFEFAYAVCHIDGLSESTFLKARKEIVNTAFSLRRLRCSATVPVRLRALSRLTTGNGTHQTPVKQPHRRNTRPFARHVLSVGRGTRSTRWPTWRRTENKSKP